MDDQIAFVGIIEKNKEGNIKYNVKQKYTRKINISLKKT